MSNGYDSASREVTGGMWSRCSLTRSQTYPSVRRRATPSSALTDVVDVNRSSGSVQVSHALALLSDRSVLATPRIDELADGEFPRNHDPHDPTGLEEVGVAFGLGLCGLLS